METSILYDRQLIFGFFRGQENGSGKEELALTFGGEAVYLTYICDSCDVANVWRKEWGRAGEQPPSCNAYIGRPGLQRLNLDIRRPRINNLFSCMYHRGHD